MEHFRVTFLPQKLTLSVPAGTTLLQAQIDAGLRPDAPCAGRGTCGKCLVHVDGQELLACQTAVDRDMTVHTGKTEAVTILTEGLSAAVTPDGSDDYVLACDIGTTTVVVYLLDGHTGALLARSSAMNPQSQFGADVISRIQHALERCLHGLSLSRRSTSWSGRFPGSRGGGALRGCRERWARPGPADSGSNPVCVTRTSPRQVLGSRAPDRELPWVRGLPFLLSPMVSSSSSSGAGSLPP